MSVSEIDPRLAQYEPGLSGALSKVPGLEAEVVA